MLLQSNFGFHSFDMQKKNHVPGQRDKHGSLNYLGGTPMEASGLHKIVLVYIKEYVCLLLLLLLALKT